MKRFKNKKENKIFKFSEVKKVINQFKKWDINYINYYKHILLNNEQKWIFCNPQNCKDSFNDVYHNIQFSVLKRMIKKEGYRLMVYKDYRTLNDRLEKTQNYKLCYDLHKP
jgi:hypothetical protein